MLLKWNHFVNYFSLKVDCWTLYFNQAVRFWAVLTLKLWMGDGKRKEERGGGDEMEGRGEEMKEKTKKKEDKRKERNKMERRNKEWEKKWGNMISKAFFQELMDIFEQIDSWNSSLETIILPVIKENQTYYIICCFLITKWYPPYLSISVVNYFFFP